MWAWGLERCRSVGSGGGFGVVLLIKKSGQVQ